MASPNLSELVTTTLRNRSGKLADNVTKNNALLAELKRAGNMDMADGGRTIVQELEYAENGTYKRYSGYEVLDISPSDVFTAAEFDWKQIAIAVTISGLEQLQNSGKSQIINLLRSRVKNAEKTFMNNLSSDLYSDGTADGGKQIGGLQHLVADSPSTGTVGGINRATWSFWRNYSRDASSSSLGSVSAGNVQAHMRNVWENTCRQSDKIGLILSDNNYYDAYWESLTDIQRITKITSGEALRGGDLMFQGARVVMDGGIGGYCPTNHMYFLNTDYIHYRPHSARNMVPLNPDRYATNQDAVVKLIGWAGNMTLSNAQLQGVLKD